MKLIEEILVGIGRAKREAKQEYTHPLPDDLNAQELVNSINAQPGLTFLEFIWGAPWTVSIGIGDYRL